VAKRGLGRGIDALIQGATNQVSEAVSGLEALPGSRVALVPRTKLYGNPDQPRKDFDPEQLGELAESIREKGILQPILVEEDPQGRFMIVAGERRFRAAGIAGLDEVPVIIRSFSEAERLEIALIENIQRENLSPVEEAKAYRQLIESFGLSQEEVAQKVGKSRSVIANALRMLKLPEEIQRALTTGELSPGHARAILAVTEGPEAQVSMFQRIQEFDLTVREAEALSKLINGGIPVEEGLPRLRSPKDEGELSIQSEKDILDLSRGATVVKGKEQTPASPRRSPELWEMEENLIRSLGTKVAIKGDEKSGRIEVSYYSQEDLERVFDLLIHGTSAS